MMTKQGIDICICTFNRVEYLRHCVELLLPQINQSGTVLTVINNNSTDSTEVYVKTIMQQNGSVRYFFEAAQGLSHARNRGWQESDHDWIFYMDDDSLPGNKIVQYAEQSITNHSDMAAIGGPIFPVFSSTPPSWLEKGFGEFKMNYEKFTIIDHGYIRGGNFLIKRSVLEYLGGFKTHLGVMGDKVAYGEEIELQDRMYLAGYQIGYEPYLKMGHYVRVEKLNLGWILHSEYARRRDKMTFAPISLIKAIAGFIRVLGGRLIHLPVYIFRLLTKKDYTLKNVLMDFMKPLMYCSGELIGVMRNLRK